MKRHSKVTFVGLVIFSCFIGFSSQAYDPATIKNIHGFEWIYYLENKTGKSLDLEGMVTEPSGIRGSTGEKVALSKISCRGKGKDVSCSNGNVAKCISAFMCNKKMRKDLYAGKQVDLPGKINLSLRINEGGKGNVLEVRERNN